LTSIVNDFYFYASEREVSGGTAMVRRCGKFGKAYFVVWKFRHSLPFKSTLIPATAVQAKTTNEDNAMCIQWKPVVLQIITENRLLRTL